MQVEGIISNPILKDTRLKGHQSIRFTPDGFSHLVSDASYRPVHLKQYLYQPSVPVSTYPSECGRIMEELQLDKFEGETVFIMDSRAMTLVPAQFFDEETSRSLLEKAAVVADSEQVTFRFIRERNFYILFSYATEINELKERIKGEVQILHTTECLLSLSDQVQASDHQRGFVLAEIQPFTLAILVIQEDGITLLNRFALKDPSDFIYHTLNIMKQLELDRETIPVYLAGIVHPEHELFGLIGKYIRHVRSTPYYLEDLERAETLRFMILSEGSKCAS